MVVYLYRNSQCFAPSGYDSEIRNKNIDNEDFLEICTQCWVHYKLCEWENRNHGREWRLVLQNMETQHKITRICQHQQQTSAPTLPTFSHSWNLSRYVILNLILSFIQLKVKIED